MKVGQFFSCNKSTKISMIYWIKSSSKIVTAINYYTHAHTGIHIHTKNTNFFSNLFSISFLSVRPENKGESSH